MASLPIVLRSGLAQKIPALSASVVATMKSGTGSSPGPVESAIRDKLASNFNPSHLEVS